MVDRSGTPTEGGVRMLRVTQEMLDQGYWRFDGTASHSCEFEVLQAMDDGTYLVRDPYADTH